MKPFSVRLVAVLVLGLFVSSLYAQSPAPAAKTRSTTSTTKTKRRIPPAPSIPMGISKYRANAKKPTQLGEADPSGRKDLAGRPVAFYPVSKGLKAVQNSASPIKQTKRLVTSVPGTTGAAGAGPGATVSK